MPPENPDKSDTHFISISPYVAPAKASKAETAHFLAEELREAELGPAAVREMLPEYITAAIDYVTGKDIPEESEDATGD